MPFFVCVVPVCPVRSEASHRSEQVTQLLFGEFCELLETADDFVKIRVVFDKYEGWCQKSQLEELAGDEQPAKGSRLASGWVNTIIFDGKPMFVPFGSLIPAEGILGRIKVEFDGEVMDTTENNMDENLLETITAKFINTPYLWGGRSVFGIDCSGFTQLVFKCMNISLLRDASQQVTQGDEVGFLQEVKYGDLAFFDNATGNITHVGILLDQSTIIHSAGKVRVDTIDNLGIVNRDTGKRTHNLRLIKRISRKPAATLLF